MSTLSSIFNSASSALYVAQTGLNAVSDNIANLNTPGYVRKVVDQASAMQQGLGMGVSVVGVTRAANQYLQNASLAAAGGVGQSGAISDLLGQAQALFGDPSSTTGYFASLNQVFSDFTAAGNDPAAALNGSQAVNDTTQFLDQSKSISSQISQLGGQADQHITSDVTQVNQLLSQISQLNTSISQVSAAGSDATDSQNAQSGLINQLSSLMDVKASTNANGTVTLSTTGGATLVGQSGAASLAYTPSNASSQITVTQPGASVATDLQLSTGELQGLLTLRNTTLPGVASQLSEFVNGAVTAINAAHNASSSAPPPAQLNGLATGVDLPTAVSHFSGATNIAIVDSTGKLVKQVKVDFSAGTMSVNGAAGASFTSASFLTSLNTALGGSGSASFTNGALSIQASAAGTGVAIADDPTTPSTSGNGEGFSQYFGLNNLITSSGVTNYSTGLSASDASGYPAGQTLTLRVADGSGSHVTDVTVTTPGGTVQNLIDTLNSPTGGVGLYGSFSLDSKGALSFTPTKPGGASLSVVSDQTQPSAGGPGVSQLFGIGDSQRASRTNTYAVRADIQSNPSNLALATLNLSAAASGNPVLSPGDGSGGLRLAAAASSTVSFAGAGDLAATTTTVSRYASLFGGQLANDANAATQAGTNAQAVQTEADTRRQSQEGVNLDQELMSMTTYQQAYNASARMVTAAHDMFTTLLTMVGP
jgi:flagellar hook-associated protein 1 FlgK